MRVVRGTLGPRPLPLASVLLASTLLAALLLSGCTGDEPDPPASSSTSTSPTETPVDTARPTLTAPALPDAATVGDAAGAEAFVRHWIDLLNYAYATGDAEPVKAVSDAGCEACQTIFSVVQQRAAGSKRLEGGLIKLVSVRSPPPDDLGLVGVSVRYEQADGVEIAPDGSRTTVTGSPPDNFGFALTYDDGAWAMAGAGSE